MAILDFDAKRNLYAVYTGAQNDAPLVNPLANLPRVKFHASLNYIGVTSQRTVTIDVSPLRNRTQKIRLFTHGKSFRPLIFATAWIGGKPVPAHSSFMARVGADIFIFYLAADATSVYLRTAGLLFTGLNGSPPVTRIRFDVSVCNVGLTAGRSPVFPPFFQGVEATPTRFRAGRFDSNNKHLTQANTGETTFYKGGSISVRQTVNALSFRQVVNGHSVSYLSSSFHEFDSTVRATIK